MSFLHSTVSLQMDWLVAAAILVPSLLVLWILILLSRRSYYTVKKSEETQLMFDYLSRIASALERLASSRESQAQPPLETNAPKAVAISMLGR